MIIPSGTMETHDRDQLRYIREEACAQPWGHVIRVSMDAFQLMPTREQHEDGRFTFFYYHDSLSISYGGSRTWCLRDHVHALLGGHAYELFWRPNTGTNGHWIVSVLDDQAAMMLKLAHGI